MKNLKKTISLLLAITILVLANIQGATATAGFTDVKTTAWYYSYVNRIMELKITAGIGNNKYGPDNSVTRAEFVTFVCKATGLAQEDGYKFTDTEKHWSSKWISAAITANIIDKGTTFNPNKAITRQEAVEILCKSLGLAEDSSMLTPYSDVKVEKGYSNTAYKEYLMIGSISNNNRYFYPNSDIKRSEVSAVVVNLVDYKADSVGYKTSKKVLVDGQEQASAEEAKRYAEWKESVKDIPSELLSNTKGLYYDSVYESYRYLKEETEVYTWGYKYNMTKDEFVDEMVRVATVYGNAYAKANYKQMDVFEQSLRTILDTSILLNNFKRKLDYIEDNTVVSDGDFITSKGMIVYTDNKQMKIRGTIRYKYSTGTSAALLNSEIVSDTKKASQLGVWYEQDVEIDFSPRNAGLKCISMENISKIRVSK